MKFACLSYHSFESFYTVDGAKSCFRSSERKVVSAPPSTQQSSPPSSHGPLRKTNLWIFARLSYNSKYCIHLCSHVKPIAYLNVGCIALGYIRFSPNNFKRKARCGSDLLEYVQVNKIMQNCERGN